MITLGDLLLTNAGEKTLLDIAPFIQINKDNVKEYLNANGYDITTSWTEHLGSYIAQVLVLSKDRSTVIALESFVGQQSRSQDEAYLQALKRALELIQLDRQKELIVGDNAPKVIKEVNEELLNDDNLQKLHDIYPDS